MRGGETMKTTPKAAFLEKKGTTLEKKDMAMDKKQGIKENSKLDLSRDAMMAKLKNARGMK
jgi:hypothetical protein